MPHAGGIYYETHGAADAPALILSAGLGGSASYWAPNIAAFAEHFHVIAYDHRGTGRSDRAMPTVDLSADVMHLMDDLKIEAAHFVGHAAGGVAGLMMGLDWPHLINRMVLVNAWGAPDPHFRRCFDVRLALLHDSGLEAYVRAQPIFLYPAEWSSAHDAELDREAAHMISGFPTLEVMERRIAMLRDFDVRESFEHYDTPMLALAAADDMLVPAHCSRLLADNIAGCRLAMMPWGGHACNVTDPETFNKLVLGFLGS